MGALRASALALVLCSVTLPSSATIQRTFVSSLGLDTNTCARDQPCRNFAAAIAQTTAGGEIVVLDSAGYGPVTVSKSIQITSPLGVYAGITGFTGAALSITAAASDAVVVRGLSLTGLGASVGIDVNAASRVWVEGCVISGFQGNGIRAFPTTTLELYVRDTTVRNGGFTGIATFGMSTVVTVSIEHCRLEHNALAGLDVYEGSRVTARDTVAAGGAAGFRLETDFSGQTAYLDLESCAASGNDIGILVFGNGSNGVEIARVSNSIITNNNTGLSYGNPGAQLLSRVPASNTVEGNTANGTFSGTYSAK